MKAILENSYSSFHQIIIAVVSSFFGYHLYQEIMHPEKSQLTLSIILMVLMYALINEYGIKPEQKDKI